MPAAFPKDTGVYLIDPEQAQHPTALVNRWILWSDRHFDLPFARRDVIVPDGNGLLASALM